MRVLMRIVVGGRVRVVIPDITTEIRGGAGGLVCGGGDQSLEL
jgi:hypothetical protein